MINHKNLLKALNKRDENKALKIIKRLYHPLDDVSLEIEIFKKAIDNCLGKVYDFLMEQTLNKDLINKKLLGHYINFSCLESLEFLSSKKFFNDNISKCIKIKNKVLHKVIKYNSGYSDLIEIHIKELLDNDNFNDLVFYIDSVFGADLYLDKVKDLDTIKQHYELGMFHGRVDMFLRESLFRGNEEFVEYFKEIGGNVENVRCDIVMDGFTYLCITNEHKSINLILKNLDIREDCQTIVEDFLRDELEEGENYKEIVRMFLRNSYEEDIIMNFFMLSHILTDNDIVDLYNEENIRFSSLKIKFHMNVELKLNKTHLYLLNELDENFIDFLKINFKGIKENCYDKESLKYIKSIL